jgi:hypothetical protein
LVYDRKKTVRRGLSAIQIIVVEGQNMRVKYSPCKSNIDSVIVVIDTNSITVDGVLHEFDDSDIFPDICVETEGAILEAHRESGILYITIRRFYTGDCHEWDTGEYQEITAK